MVGGVTRGKKGLRPILSVIARHFAQCRTIGQIIHTTRHTRVRETRGFGAIIVYYGPTAKVAELGI